MFFEGIHQRLCQDELSTFDYLRYQTVRTQFRCLKYSLNKKWSKIRIDISVNICVYIRGYEFLSLAETINLSDLKTCRFRGFSGLLLMMLPMRVAWESKVWST